MKTPMHMTDEDINNLVEKGLLAEPVKAIDEHPLSTWIYKHFKAGSNVLTKPKAYDIGNTLDAQFARIRELEEQVSMLQAAGGNLVRQVMSARESLGKKP